MSPACLATIFEGDNGGATSTGVSATEIRVAVPGPPGTATRVNRVAAMRALFEHFNRRFEFYGRRLVPVLTEGVAWEGAPARAFGAAIAAEGVFGAASGYLEAYGADAGQAVQPGLLHELVRNSVVTVAQNSGIGWPDKTNFDPFHPYLWGVYPSAEANQDNLAALACTALAGRPASHATDVSLQTTIRRFGILAYGTQTAPNYSRLAEGLTTCDREPLVASLTRAGDLRAAFERLRSAGATSLVCLCEGLFGYISVRSTATGMGFNPEWLLLPSPLNFEEFLVNGNTDRKGLIRLESGPRLLPIQARPWFGPLLESYTLDTTDETRRDGFYMSQAIYSNLMVLASGIQAAGPNLTPETFAAGLMSIQFPNPGAGQSPYYQPSAGFGAGDHSFHDDYAVAWWSDTAPSVDAWSAQGSWCYLGAGARFRVGTYPADADTRLYNANEPCR